MSKAKLLTAFSEAESKVKEGDLLQAFFNSSFNSTKKGSYIHWCDT
jgi:hypothetical protein